MGLFGLGAKHKPAVEHETSSRPKQKSAAPGAAFREPPVGIEVSEFSLDEDDFSSMFSGENSRFSDTTFGAQDTDPWSSKRRID